MSIEFPAYRSYGVPNPDMAVPRIVEGPLNPELVEVFDDLVTAAFRVGRIEMSEAWATVPEESAGKIDEALTEVGIALLGDAQLVDDVCTVLGDGIAEGDVLEALADLHASGSLKLGPAMRSQIERSGVVIRPRDGGDE